MRKSNKKICFLIEGETERALLDALKCQGKKQVFNLWNNDIKKIYPRLRMDILYIVYDTDRIDNCKRFNSNLDFLDKNKIQFFLLQQTNNLEDELIENSKCRKIEDFFQCSLSEFKSSFISCNNLSHKLNEWEVQIDSLWNGRHITQLSKWENKRKLYKDIS